MTIFVTDQPVGVDPYAVNTTPDFQTGTRFATTGDGEIVYVQASSAVAQYDACVYNLDSGEFKAAPATGAAVNTEVSIGVALSAIPLNSYGWLAIKGEDATIQVNVGASAAAGAKPLYTTATAGRLDDADGGGQFPIIGITLSAPRGGTPGPAACQLLYPTGGVALV